MNYTFEELSSKVISWANNRDLIRFENANRQFLKVTEEVGELAGAIARKDDREIEDAMGDTLVTLIILSKQLGIDPVECLAVAYAVIANRTGKTVNGVFIKDEE
jgi:NTP pyrophosphatase (non-canonical NTP hydrolase)